jgi:hypothetical protein
MRENAIGIREWENRQLGNQEFLHSKEAEECEPPRTKNIKPQTSNNQKIFRVEPSRIKNPKPKNANVAQEGSSGM